MSKKPAARCLVITAAWLALFALPATAIPPDPPSPEAKAASLGSTPVVEREPVGPQDPSKFIPVAATPEPVEVGPAQVVDMRRVPVTPELLKADGRDRVHIQGRFEQFGPRAEKEWSRTPLNRREHETPMAEIEYPEAKASGPGATKEAGDYVVGFDAHDFTGSIPPDIQMAAGPEYIVEAVNSGFMVYSKTGTLTRDYTHFETFVTLPSLWDGFCFDPKVVFHKETNQFVMTIMGLDNTNLNSFVWILISQTANPNGEWWMYRIDTSFGTAGNEQWLDYASLGVDHWGIYIAGNSFGFPGVSAFQGRVWSYSPSMLTGGAGLGVVWNDLRWPGWPFPSSAASLQVARPHTQNASGNTFLVNTYGSSGSKVCLWKLSGDRYPGQGIGAPSLTRATITTEQYYAIGNNVDQAGSAWDIDGGDCRVQNAVYSKGKLYGTFTRDRDNSKSYSEIYIFALNTGDSTMAWDYSLWNSSTFMMYPAIAIEGTVSNPNWFIAFSATQPAFGAPDGYVGAMGFNRDPVDDTTRWFWETRGGGAYSRWDGDFVGDGRNRWGDYNMATYDWTCENVWGATEFATDSNTWATRIVAHTIGDEAACTYIRVAHPNAGGTITAGWTQIVTWDKLNLPPGDDLWISFWDGGRHHIYGPMSTSLSWYEWTIPNIPTTQGQIFIGSSDGAAYTVSDWSDSVFTVVGLPDLVKASFTPPVSAIQGESFGQYNSVKNDGAETAGSFTVELRISANSLCSGGDTLLSARTVTSLSAGGLDSDTPTITIPAGQAIGTNYLCMMIDSQGAVSEFDETNNVTATAITIIPSLLFEDGFESGATGAWSNTVP